MTTVRVTMRPHEYEYIRFRPNHKKWGAYSQGRLGEITLTDGRLCLTFIDGLDTKPPGRYVVGVDLNFATVDCTAIGDGGVGRPQTISASDIEHIQDSFSRRRRRLQLHVVNPRKRAKKLRENSGRQRLRVRDALHKLTTGLVRRYPEATFVFENLKGIRRKAVPKGRRFRTRLSRWPYRMAQAMVDYVSQEDSVSRSERDFVKMSRMWWKTRVPNLDSVRHKMAHQRVPNVRCRLRQEPAGQPGHSLPWQTPLRTTVLGECGRLLAA